MGPNGNTRCTRFATDGGLHWDKTDGDAARYKIGFRDALVAVKSLLMLLGEFLVYSRWQHHDHREAGF